MDKKKARHSQHRSSWVELDHPCYVVSYNYQILKRKTFFLVSADPIHHKTVTSRTWPGRKERPKDDFSPLFEWVCSQSLYLLVQGMKAKNVLWIKTFNCFVKNRDTKSPSVEAAFFFFLGGGGDKGWINLVENFVRAPLHLAPSLSFQTESLVDAWSCSWSGSRFQVTLLCIGHK